MTHKGEIEKPRDIRRTMLWTVMLKKNIRKRNKEMMMMTN